MFTNKTIGQRIRELRLTKKMIQIELAKEAKIDFSYLSKIETDKVRAGGKVIKNLAKALAGDNISYKNLYAELMLLNDKIPEALKEDILKHKGDLIGELHRPKSHRKSLYRKYREMCKAKK